MGLCQGPIQGIQRIWIGADLFYDAQSDDFNTVVASNEAANGFKLYLGTETQLPDPRLEADVQVENAPAYRGLAYLVFYDLPLARHGNSLAGAQVKVEVVKNGDDNPWAYTVRSMPTARTWRSTAWNGAIFCSIANNSNKCATSPDGITWTEHDLPATMNGYSIATDGKVFVAAFVSKILSSEEGIVWVERLSYGGYFTQIVYGLGTFLAIMDTGNWWTSEDGLVWLAQPAPGIGLGIGVGNYGKSLACNGQCFVAVTHFGAHPVVIRSASGLQGTWSVVATLTTSSGWDAMATKERRFCLTSNAHSGTYVSDDGIAWTYYSNAVYNVNSITSGYGVFLCTNQDSYYVSEDGISWDTYNFPTPGIAYTAATWNGAWFSVLADHASLRALTIKPNEFSDSAVSLADLLTEECLQSGLISAGDLDVTGMTDLVRGYRIGSLGAIRSAIEPLQGAWPFDVIQQGYQIRFIHRGSASVATIPAVDLDAREGSSEPGVQTTISREMDSQMPRRVTIKYLDRVREYDHSEQYAERLNTDAINLLALDLPIVLTANEAAQKAEVLLYLYWMERYDVTFTLPPTYLHLEPADVVTVETLEGNMTLRLTAVNYTSDNRLECKAKYADTAVYTSTAQGESPVVNGPVTIPTVSASRYVLLDIPAIDRVQDTPSLLAGMRGVRSGWPGGVLVRSLDGGSSWSDLQAFAPPGMTIGTAANSIGAPDSWRLVDSASALKVFLSNGALYSITQLQMFAGGNHFAYGVPGRWEIIAAQNCVLQGDGSYLLTNLLRARFGTDWCMGSHVVGDLLVLIDSDDLAWIGMQSAQINLPLLYRGITEGQDLSSDKDLSFTYAGVNLKPYRCIGLSGDRHPSSNDWTLIWTRRTRVEGEWRDGVEVPLGETVEAYEVLIYSNGSYTTVKRTISVSTSTCTYTSAQQVADFGSNQGTLYLTIYQLSSVVGRGNPYTLSITR